MGRETRQAITTGDFFSLDSEHDQHDDNVVLESKGGLLERADFKGRSRLTRRNWNNEAQKK
jgi:hypothetical protein